MHKNEVFENFFWQNANIWKKICYNIAMTGIPFNQNQGEKQYVLP